MKSTNAIPEMAVGGRNKDRAKRRCVHLRAVFVALAIIRAGNSRRKRVGSWIVGEMSGDDAIIRTGGRQNHAVRADGARPGLYRTRAAGPADLLFDRLIATAADPWPAPGRSPSSTVTRRAGTRWQTCSTNARPLMHNWSGGQAPIGCPTVRTSSSMQRRSAYSWRRRDARPGHELVGAEHGRGGHHPQSAAHAARGGRGEARLQGNRRVGGCW